ncbi:MAG: hypothetical protein F4146_02860, partial [Rhodothermaceae bacterium]|nr:hypothetical protein [Rhodothermaceae bacterium]
MLLAVGCSTPSSEKDRALADVNGYSITVGEFERSYVDVLIRSGQNDTPGARYSHLNTLIEDQIWYEEALRRELDADTSLALFIDLA